MNPLHAAGGRAVKNDGVTAKSMLEENCLTHKSVKPPIAAAGMTAACGPSNELQEYVDKAATQLAVTPAKAVAGIFEIEDNPI